MTYIVGTKFTIHQSVVRPGISSSVKRNAPIGNYLQPGNYTVSYIKKNSDNTVTYTFQDDNLAFHPVTFNSIAQADTYISSARGEQIPNYELVYKNLS